MEHRLSIGLCQHLTYVYRGAKEIGVPNLVLLTHLLYHVPYLSLRVTQAIEFLHSQKPVAFHVQSFKLGLRLREFVRG